MISFNEKEKNILSTLGKTHEGKEFMNILNRIKKEMDSVKGITSNYDAEVIGRQFVVSMIETLEQHIFKKERISTTYNRDDFES